MNIESNELNDSVAQDYNEFIQFGDIDNPISEIFTDTISDTDSNSSDNSFSSIDSEVIYNYYIL